MYNLQNFEKVRINIAFHGANFQSSKKESRVPQNLLTQHLPAETGSLPL